MKVVIHQSLLDVDASVWDGFEHGASPFLRHGFLRALEESGSVGPQSGWQPIYLVAEEEGRLVGATAVFIKTDSYGEYIFDWAWARAAERAGLHYYPKLVVAAPFTPATGKRFLVQEGASGERVIEALCDKIDAIALKFQCSSIHILFCTKEEQKVLQTIGFTPRASFQFHWKNRDYKTYDDFLSQLRSRKRKQLKKERRVATDAVDQITFVSGRDITKDDLAHLDRFYRNTVMAHGGFDYLKPGFFDIAHKYMPEVMTWASAQKDGKTIAGAIFFETEGGLYGRYWGADRFVEQLHFEMAYHQGIERCIEKGIPLFEAGAQGEHKLLRGFEPSPTYSAHKIKHPGFKEAVDGFLVEEKLQIAERIKKLAEYGPYRCDE